MDAHNRWNKRGAIEPLRIAKVHSLLPKATVLLATAAGLRLDLSLGCRAQVKTFSSWEYDCSCQQLVQQLPWEDQTTD